jgi:hypothetical protein
VEVLDSALLEIVFDDFLPTGGPLDSVLVRLTRDEDPGPEVSSLVWQQELDSLMAFQDSVEAAEARRILLDSLQVVVDSLQEVLADLEAAGDSVGVDSVASALAVVETQISPPQPRERPGTLEPPPPPPVLPLQSFFALLADPLAPEVLYQVTVSGVANVNGLTGGGGESGITWTPPEDPADTVAVSDTATAPDTAGVPPDTGVVAFPPMHRFRHE